MANKHRAEKVFIFGEKGWKLRTTLQLLAEFEGESGLTLAELVEKIRTDLLSDSDYLALEHVIRRNLKLDEPFLGSLLASFKKQIKELLLETFYELNPGFEWNLPANRDAFNIPWADLMHICVFYLKIPFEQFWNLTLPETKIFLHGLGGTVYSRISPAEIKEIRDILKLA